MENQFHGTEIKVSQQDHTSSGVFLVNLLLDSQSLVAVGSPWGSSEVFSRDTKPRVCVCVVLL